MPETTNTTNDVSKAGYNRIQSGSSSTTCSGLFDFRARQVCGKSFAYGFTAASSFWAIGNMWNQDFEPWRDVLITVVVITMCIAGKMNHAQLPLKNDDDI